MGVRDLISIATVGGYYPYTIVVYQIYLALVESKGHKPVSGAGTAIFLMLSKALSLVLHAATVNCRAELRGLKLQLLAFTAITTTALIIAARSDVDGYLTLGCVSTLPLTTSRAIGSCLMAAPSEAVTKRRIVCYDLAAAPGCLWTALVIYVLSTTAGRSSWPLRALVLNLPVLVTLLAWVLFPASEFYGPSRLAQIEAQIKASKTEPKPKKRTSLVRVRADSWNSWTQVIIEEVDAHREQPQLLGELPPEPSSEAEKEGKPPIPWAWFNPCFRVLAATHSIIFWCFAGVLYTVPWTLFGSQTFWVFFSNLEYVFALSLFSWHFMAFQPQKTNKGQPVGCMSLESNPGFPTSRIRDRPHFGHCQCFIHCWRWCASSGHISHHAVGGQTGRCRVFWSCLDRASLADHRGMDHWQEPLVHVLAGSSGDGLAVQYL